MADFKRNEKSSLVGKKSTKYGTTTNSAYKTNEAFFKHTPKPGETLQGIALKYEVSIEQIKRTNNLWTNDSLFLKDYLLIPIVKKPVQSPDSAISMTNGDIAVASTSKDSPAEIVTRQEINACRIPKSSTKDSVVSNGTGSDVKPVAANDFFSKFDSSLKSIRKNVEKLEETTSFPEDPNDPFYINHRKKKLGKHQSKGYSFDYGLFANDVDPVTTQPDLMFKSRSKSMKFPEVTERLEKEQDNIFQL